MRFIYPLVAALCIVLPPTAVVAAPDDPDDPGNPAASVAGVVLDETGGVIPGASVVLTVPNRRVEETVSDATGRFLFRNIPPGPATVSVRMNGFAAATLEVEASRPPVRVVLRPLAVSEHVTVRAAERLAGPVSAATRTETPLRDVPQAITVVSRDEIQAQSMQGMADVVRYIPGIGMGQGEGNRDVPIFRGNASTSDFFVDGLRDDVQYFRDLYNVERVEALKGANAMMFGRGGAGGVINRVTRQANWSPVHEAALQTGSFGNRRATLDVGQAVGRQLAVRATAMYENSDSYRSGAGVERYGFNPTMSMALGTRTLLNVGFERFHDERTADRGIPSFDGRPVDANVATFFGDPRVSNSVATVNAVSVMLERKFDNGLTARNRTRYADYDKFYQNVFARGMNPAGDRVSLSAYNNATTRRNLFNQTDLVFSLRTGRVAHTLLAGTEFGRQATGNFRNTGYFNADGAALASISVPLEAPTVSVPVAFRQSATDADNRGVATVAAVYVQDQAQLSTHLQAIAGLRFDRFEVAFHNNRTNADVGNVDRLVEPRFGIVFKPALPVSIYGSYSLAYVPRAGEQLSSLSLTNKSLAPEEFRNYEVGAKWDARRGLSFTAAVYRLDRRNVAVPDPLNPAATLLVDGQRTSGLELGLAGKITSAWSLMAAYSYQQGEITHSLSSTAPAGAALAQVPANSVSIWNRYEVSRRIGAGIGIIHRDRVFTSTDNTVVLPAFTRVDGALFVTLSSRLRAQANVENLFDGKYYASANGNNNITPGSPRALRVSLTAGF